MSIEEVSFLEGTDKEVLQLCKAYKLSVSSVKYSRGHDADCMEANLKNRIKNCWNCLG